MGSQGPSGAEQACQRDQRAGRKRGDFKRGSIITDTDKKHVDTVKSRAFEMLPATGSVASHVQSVAERNTGGG